MKKNLTFIVSIAWQKTSSGTTETRLRTSIYFKDRDGVNSEDEALGRAMREQKKEFDVPAEFSPFVHNTASTWQSAKKSDLSCLRYC
ncbi:hypothetical protein J7384_17940 [Endozoicomonas sp. G2_1]|uniref:hypothetical protein n=1 Tax=Endozoicomonas sp. G2_1 TaxID=2821091 RepID=UPI001ADB2714|nr:hypothetical protein [Endozoicomonas sp. G2_1]MBO9492098.1 hypothetical protein [Endozoicomonas sp. G2_1]MBO9492248.1 hypothetical protein [Endozoicomonas sp. G2_1]